jgi:hypothetical protein
MPGYAKTHRPRPLNRRQDYMDNSNILNVLTDHYLEPQVCCPTNWQHLETIGNSHYLIWSICGVNLPNFTTIHGERMRCYILRRPPIKFYLAYRAGNCNNVTLALRGCFTWSNVVLQKMKINDYKRCFTKTRKKASGGYIC